MPGLKDTIDRLVTANEAKWYGHVLRRDDDSVLRVALDQCYSNAGTRTSADTRALGCRYAVS